MVGSLQIICERLRENKRMSGNLLRPFLHRRALLDSQEGRDLEREWSWQQEWAGVRIIGHRHVGSWVVVTFDGEVPNELVPLLPGEPCDQRGRIG